MIDVICIIDKSGSMHPLRDDTIGAFNEFLEEQKQLPEKARLTLALFDHEYQLVHDRVKLKKVDPLTQETYSPGGYTALLDAVGKTLTSLKDREKAIVVIITDGYENASEEYNRDAIRILLEDQQEKGWEVHYLGVGVDDFHDAHSIGIEKTSSFQKSAQGTRDAYGVATGAVATYRIDNK